MALAIDGSSPAVATGSTQPVTTASFTPPTDSLLLVAVDMDSLGGSNPATPTVTDNLGTHLTYSLIGWQSRADSPTVNGQAAMWWAKVGTSAAMTVSVTNHANDGSPPAYDGIAVKVYVITGQDTVGPIGASGKSGSSTTLNPITVTYSAQATNGWGFITADQQEGSSNDLFTAGTGCTADAHGGFSDPQTGGGYAFVRRTTADDVNGSNNTLNVAVGTHTVQAFSWVWGEVLPAGFNIYVPDTPSGARAGTSLSTLHALDDMLGITFTAEADTPSANVGYNGQTYLLPPALTKPLGSGTHAPANLIGVWGFANSDPTGLQWIMTPILAPGISSDIDQIPSVAGWTIGQARASYRAVAELLLDGHSIGGPDVWKTLSDLFNATRANIQQSTSDRPAGARLGSSDIAGVTIPDVLVFDTPSGARTSESSTDVTIL